MEYYSAMRKKEILLCENTDETWSHYAKWKARQRLYDFHLHVESKKTRQTSNSYRVAVTRLKKVRDWEILVKGQICSLKIRIGSRNSNKEHSDYSQQYYIIYFKIATRLIWYSHHKNEIIIMWWDRGFSAKLLWYSNYNK